MQKSRPPPSVCSGAGNTPTNSFCSAAGNAPAIDYSRPAATLTTHFKHSVTQTLEGNEEEKKKSEKVRTL